jgi:hypothetical protein
MCLLTTFVLSKWCKQCVCLCVSLLANDIVKFFSGLTPEPGLMLLVLRVLNRRRVVPTCESAVLRGRSAPPTPRLCGGGWGGSGRCGGVVVIVRHKTVVCSRWQVSEDARP